MQVRESTCIGIDGASTGTGLFTVLEMPTDTFVSAYAPTATVGWHDPNRSGDYLVTVPKEGFPWTLTAQKKSNKQGWGKIAMTDCFLSSWQDPSSLG